LNKTLRDRKDRKALDHVPGPRATQEINENDDLYGAFRIADQVCRASPFPAPQDLILRSICLKAMGDVAASDQDLLRAVDIDADDVGAQYAVMTRHSDPSIALGAAVPVATHRHATGEQHETALNVLLRSRPAMFHAERQNGRVEGWVFWAGTRVPTVRWTTAGRCGRIKLSPDVRSTTSTKPGTGTFTFDTSEHEALTLTLTLDNEPADQVALQPTAPPNQSVGGRRTAAVSVVIPVYAGLDATTSCLDGVARQDDASALDVIVVDDASPDPALRRHVENRCAEEGWRLIRQGINGGFAAAVNAGLAEATGAHVLLLNADATLPDGAISRMVSAARNPSIGTIVPFSNDGGFTSFPTMRRSHPMPSPDEARSIDDDAKRANPGKVIDIPSGTAFCMLVTRSCLDAVGWFDHGYGRGYFEDVDFCLRAAGHGFRNVACADVYVAHHGGQSFGGEKKALAARNAKTIDERFPRYDLVWRSFVDDDPLASARSAIEKHMTIHPPTILLVGRIKRFGALLDLRATELHEDGTHVVNVDWDRHGTIRFRAWGGGSPQNIRFAPQDSEGFRHYMDQMSLMSMEIVEPDALPPMLRDALKNRPEPCSIFVADRTAATFVREDRPEWLKPAPIVPADRMVSAFLGRTNPNLPVPSHNDRPSPSKVENVVIGIPLPVPDPQAMQFISVFAKMLDTTPGSRAVILGRGPDTWLTHKSRISATGPMVMEDYPAACGHHGVSHILLPYPDRLFRLAEDLKAATGLPMAYIDWSDNALDHEPGDLALRPGRNDRMAAAVLSWTDQHRQHLATDDVMHRADYQRASQRRHILDAGSGAIAAARMPPMFTGPSWTRVTIDIDPEARPHHVGSLSDMRSLFDNGTFDAVWSSHSLEHMYLFDLRRALAEMRRVLKRDGFALVTCPDLEAVAAGIAEHGLDHVAYHAPAGPITLHDIVFGHTASIERGAVAMAHRTGLTTERLGNLAIEAGFETALIGRGQGYELWAVLLMPDTDRRVIEDVLAGTPGAFLTVPERPREIIPQDRTFAA